MEASTSRKRSLLLDTLKGLSILAVVLYHFGGGVLPYGYLGVDVFLVIGGYLLVKQLRSRFISGSFRYFPFLLRKLLRLWLPLLLCVIASMVLGYLLMLPDDYENLAESAVASSFFGNNILLCVTTGNYWDVANFFKPLMHLWYAGLLMQCYVLLPLLYLLSVKIFRDVRRGLLACTAFLFVASILLYMLPNFPDAWKFYYPPFRIFELAAGGLVALCPIRASQKTKKAGTLLTALVVVALFCHWGDWIPSPVMLLLTVAVSAACLLFAEDLQVQSKPMQKIQGSFAFFGKRSYSIYIWHQVIIAFLFYSFYEKRTLSSILLFAGLTILLSLLSYRFIEVPLDRIAKGEKKKTFVLATACAFLALAVAVPSFLVYRNAGVVRDVPELGIKKGEVHRNMHGEYVDVPYAWDREFQNDGRIKVLVIGDSFARDWANILHEWDTENKLDISYIYPDEKMESKANRITEADFVFSSRRQGLSLSKKNAPLEKIYVVGYKNYGASNGIIYAKRNAPDYFSQTVEADPETLEDNKQLLEEYGDHFIDLMAPVLEGNRVKVFTDDNMFISQDCQHLTKAGAQYYARILNLEAIFQAKK